MKKCSVFLMMLAFLVVITSGNFMGSPSVSAQEDGQGNKINSLLSLQVKTKLRSMEAQAAPAASGEAQVFQALPQQAGAAPGRQQIFIHSPEMLTSSQIEELEDIGITVYPESWIPPVASHPTGFILADMPVDKLDELAAKDYIATLDTAERYLEAHNDLGIQKINANDVWSANYTGANVTIAVLDSGLDVTHNDIPTPVASKDYSYWPTLDDTISNNVTGHGTHVTGSALGRGTQSSGVYKGTAPGADLVFLKIGNDTNSNASSSAIINAIKAAVDTSNADIITMSYGGWSSYHDGSSQMAQAADYAVSQGAVVFISAGNEGDNDEHYSGNVSASSSTGYIQINVTNSSGSNSVLYFNLVWYDGTGTSNDLELEYYDSSYTLLTPTWHTAQSESSRGTESEYSGYGPSQGSMYYLPSGNLTYYFKVKNTSASLQSFHIYEHGIGSVKFHSPDPEYTIGDPAEADSAIAVGAYNTRQIWWDYDNNGRWYPDDPVDQISTFSSRGPRVDTGAPNKPSIVAPGCGIISSRDGDVYTWPPPSVPAGYSYIDNDAPNTDNATRNDGSGPADYYMMQGTSMACPMAAGVAALLLEKYPSATPAQIKQAIESTVTDKGAAGFDTTYGYGLVDALAALGYDLTLPTMETIAEAQGQYFNTAPVLSNFGFDDETALDDGWYQMDSYSGSWATLFANDADTAWDSNNWTVPGFGGLIEGSHTIYFKASDDIGNIEGESGEWSWQFYKDTISPGDPTSVNSTSHATSVWSSDNTVDITWTDATDNLSGLDGYSILWNTDNSTIPDAVKDIEEGSENTTSSALIDGSSHYFHIRSVDNTGNWQSTIHLGPFYIDTTPPTDPTSVNSTSHATSVWSSDNTVDITWTDATDGTSGLDGYSVLWDTNYSTIPDQTKDIEEGVQTATSTTLADGTSHYFHITSVDNAGNWQSTIHLGPFYIDAGNPTIGVITEAQGQYHSTAPVFSNLSFDDGAALDYGWYQMDSYSGNWTVLFPDLFPAAPIGTRFIILNPTSGGINSTITVRGEGFNQSTDTTDKYAIMYFSSEEASPVDDIDSDVTAYEIVKDGIWLDENGEFEVDFTVPNQLNDGEDEDDDEDVTAGTYYVYVCHYLNTVPPSVATRIRALAEFTVTDGIVYPWSSENWTIPGFDALSQGSHTIYFKASDDIGNIEGESGEWSWQFYKDTILPTDPINVSSPSHSIITWSSDNTIDMTWTDATDNLSGLDGYSILWDTNSTTIPDQIKDIEEAIQATESVALADGNSHYFHITSVDNAGNWQTTVHIGPFFIDTTPPTMETITEAQGQYYSTAPILSNFGFDDNMALDDGLYQMDSYIGSWITLFIDASGTARDSDNCTIPGFDALANGSHTIYFKASDDTGNIGGESGEWGWQFYKGSPPSPPSGGGGGGGGGGGAGITPVRPYLRDNEFTEDVSARSEDYKVELFIPEGTVATNAIGASISSIRIQPMAELPVRPQDTSTVAIVYEMGPAGAIFNPPVDLIMEYDESKIPEGVAEKTLVLSFYDDSTGEWTDLESTVDTENNTVTAKVSHFSAFTVLAYTRPASFTVADLSVIPDEIELGESLNISVLVTNDGNFSGSYEVSLKMDDLPVQTKEVTIAGGDNKIVSFSTTPDTAGEHIIDVCGVKGTCNVEKPKTPATFSASDLTISPAELLSGAGITIGITLTNTGELTGTHEVTLKIDDFQVETKTVTLNGGESQQVVFIKVQDIVGAHSVDIEGLADKFEVKELSPKEEKTEMPAPAATPALEPGSEPEPVPTQQTNRWLIVGIITGIILIGVASYYFIKKKRGTV